MVCRTNRLSGALVFVVAGCASAPPPALQSIPQNATFAYAVGKFDPKLSLDTTSPGTHAGLGAAGGALQGLGVCAAGGGNPIGLAIFLVCAPFGALVGGGVGAGIGSSGKASTEMIATAESRMAAASKALSLQQDLSAQVDRYARGMSIKGLQHLRDEGPATPEDRPRYRAGPDYVIEISITSVQAGSPGSADLAYSFLVAASGRLVRVADNSVVDAFSRSIRTAPRRVHEWVRGDEIFLEMRRVVLLLGQSFIDEWLLVYREDYRDAKTISTQTNDEVPEYVIRPREWPLRVRFPPQLSAVTVESAAPTLHWEKLPATLPAAFFSGDQPRARNLVYDVRVFSSVGGVPGDVRSAAGSLLRQYNGLKEPSVQIKPDLAYCNRYFWTVRARFELDGRPRFTEWSGAFNVGDAPGAQRIRRGQGIIGNVRYQSFLFPFVTPNFGGEACPSASGIPRYPKQ